MEQGIKKLVKIGPSGMKFLLKIYLEGGEISGGLRKLFVHENICSSEPHIYRIAKYFESEGLIESKKYILNKRAKEFVLTEKGKKLAKCLLEAVKILEECDGKCQNTEDSKGENGSAEFVEEP